MVDDPGWLDEVDHLDGAIATVCHLCFDFPHQEHDIVSW